MIGPISRETFRFHNKVPQTLLFPQSLFIKSNTSNIEHGLLIPCVAIFCFGWGSHIRHRFTDLMGNPHSWDSGTIRKQAAQFSTPETLIYLIVNFLLYIQIAIH